MEHKQGHRKIRNRKMNDETQNTNKFNVNTHKNNPVELRTVTAGQFIIVDLVRGASVLQKEYKDHSDNQNKNSPKAICAASRSRKQET